MLEPSIDNQEQTVTTSNLTWLTTQLPLPKGNTFRATQRLSSSQLDLFCQRVKADLDLRCKDRKVRSNQGEKGKGGCNDGGSSGRGGGSGVAAGCGVGGERGGER